MADRTSQDFWSRRLPLYAYLAPLWQGRRVLEIGCAGGASADYLAGHGADRVVSLDLDAAAVERARVRYRRPRLEFRTVVDLAGLIRPPDGFDLVVVADGQEVLGEAEALAALKRMLDDDGWLVIGAPSAERRSPAFAQGVGYYEVADALAPYFPHVRMLGQTPFFGFGLVEFDGGAEGLRVDVSMVEGGTESPSHYVAVGGTAPPPPLGYALVQIPAAPLEARLVGGDGRAAASSERVEELGAEIVRLTKQLELARTRERGVETGAAEARAELAERRLDETERRARARADEAEARISELRRKLDETLAQGESAVRVARAQGDEIEELRGRLRRAAEDRAAADAELAKLRRALTETDESVLALTRRTAEEMATVAQKMAAGLRAAGDGEELRERIVELGVVREESGRLRVQLAETEARAVAAERRLEEESTARRTREAPGPEGASRAASEREWEELGARLRRAEEEAARGRAEAATLEQQLRAATEQIRALKDRVGGTAERDDRIAHLERDKQDLIWQVAGLEEKLRHTEADSRPRGSASEELDVARGARDRAIEEFHRAAAAHVNEVNRLQASVSEQGALVAELEDALQAAEARSAAAEKEAAALRRGGKELEEADRARRGRLAELEGKLLRLERERAAVVPAGAGAGAPWRQAPEPPAEIARRLQALEQRALSAEQRAAAGEEARAAAAGEVQAMRERLERAERARTEAEAALERAREQIGRGDERIGTLERELGAVRAELDRATAAASAAASAPPPTNGSPAAAVSSEVLAVIEEIEERVREEMRTLTVVEDTLARAREESARVSVPAGDRTEQDRLLASKDAQLAEGRLEMARIRRDAEAREAALAREISDLRSKLLGGTAAGGPDDYSTQLIFMHTTLANIRRRAARLRVELEGFRRRLDTLPPGALSSMLEEIGEDLAEFAK